MEERLRSGPDSAPTKWHATLEGRIAKILVVDSRTHLGFSPREIEENLTLHSDSSLSLDVYRYHQYSSDIDVNDRSDTRSVVGFLWGSQVNDRSRPDWRAREVQFPRVFESATYEVA